MINSQGSLDRGPDRPPPGCEGGTSARHRWGHGLCGEASCFWVGQYLKKPEGEMCAHDNHISNSL